MLATCCRLHIAHDLSNAHSHFCRCVVASWRAWRVAKTQHAILVAAVTRGAVSFARRNARACFKIWRRVVVLRRGMRKLLTRRAARRCGVVVSAWRHWAATRHVKRMRRTRADRHARRLSITATLSAWQWAWRALTAADRARRRMLLHRVFTTMRRNVAARRLAVTQAVTAARFSDEALARRVLYAWRHHHAVKRRHNARIAIGLAARQRFAFQLWATTTAWCRRDAAVHVIGVRLARRRVFQHWAAAVATWVSKRIAHHKALTLLKRHTLLKLRRRAVQLSAIRHMTALVGACSVPRR